MLATPNEIGRALVATPGLFLDLQALRTADEEFD